MLFLIQLCYCDVQTYGYSHQSNWNNVFDNFRLLDSNEEHKQLIQSQYQLQIGEEVFCWLPQKTCTGCCGSLKRSFDTFFDSKADQDEPSTFLEKALWNKPTVRYHSCFTTAIWSWDNVFCERLFLSSCI